MSIPEYRQRLADAFQDVVLQVGEEVVPGLAKALKNGDPTVRDAVMEAMRLAAWFLRDPHSSMPPKVSFDRPEIRCPKSSVACDRMAAAVVNALDEKHISLEDATWLLSEIGGSPGIPVLLRALSEETYIRRAIQGLGRTGDLQAVPGLLDMLDASCHATKITEHQDAVVEALNAIGVEAWLAALRDRRAVVRTVAARRLEEWQCVRGEPGSSRVQEGIPLVGLPRIPRREPWEPATAEERLDYLIAKRKWDDVVKLSGNRAAEEILEQLFGNPVLWEDPEPEGTDGNPLQDIFLDYTAIILQACAYRLVQRESGYDKGGHSWEKWSHDTSDSTAAVKRLCEIDSKVSANILHIIVRCKRDLSVTVGYHCDFTSTGSLSFEHEREMARRELERRGSPPYDPAIFLDPRAWHL